MVGKAARIGAILKAGGYTVSFSALGAGGVVISWYEVPAGAHVVSVKKTSRPVLVASGRLSFTAAGTGTLKLKLTPTGRKLLKRAKQHIKITAKGTFTPTGKAAVSKIVTVTLRR